MSTLFLRRYKHLLLNVTTAAGLLSFGDFCTQKIYEKKKDIDNKRLIAACVTGIVLGVEGHIWYSFLDRIIAQPTWRNVFKKVILDQTIASPINTTTYIIGTSILEARTSMSDLKNDTKENFLPLYLADCLFFIPIQMINFKYVPAYYRVPFMFVTAFIFGIFLSAYKHAHEED